MESSTKNYSLPVLFEAFSAIKLDIATGLQNQGWLPSPSDIEHYKRKLAANIKL